MGQYLRRRLPKEILYHDRYLSANDWKNSSLSKENFALLPDLSLLQSVEIGQ